MVASMVILLANPSSALGILYDGDFNKLNANPLIFVIFINLKRETFAEGQSFVVHSGLREASVMRSIAWAPAFI